MPICGLLVSMPHTEQHTLIETPAHKLHTNW